MRSIDRYRQRYKKNTQSSKEKQDRTVDWDFETNNQTTPIKFAITLDQANDETDEERFERYIRQLGRSILACSLCNRGCKMFSHNNVNRVPHFQPSIWHKKVMLLKWEPDGNDVDCLFNDIKPILNEYDMTLDDFYTTSVIKCAGDDDHDCPYFDLEWKALSKCPPNLILCFDEQSAFKIGIDFIPRKIQKGSKYKYYCVDNHDGLKLILKTLFNPQIRNSLIS